MPMLYTVRIERVTFVPIIANDEGEAIDKYLNGDYNEADEYDGDSDFEVTDEEDIPPEAASKMVEEGN